MKMNCLSKVTGRIFFSLDGDFLYVSGRTEGEDEDRLDIITVRFADQESITLTIILYDDDF